MSKIPNLMLASIYIPIEEIRMYEKLLHKKNIFGNIPKLPAGMKNVIIKKWSVRFDTGIRAVLSINFHPYLYPDPFQATVSLFHKNKCIQDGFFNGILNLRGSWYLNQDHELYVTSSQKKLKQLKARQKRCSPHFSFAKTMENTDEDFKEMMSFINSELKKSNALPKL